MIYIVIITYNMITNNIIMPVFNTMGVYFTRIKWDTLFTPFTSVLRGFCVLWYICPLMSKKPRIRKNAHFIMLFYPYFDGDFIIYGKYRGNAVFTGFCGFWYGFFHYYNIYGIFTPETLTNNDKY